MSQPALPARPVSSRAFLLAALLPMLLTVAARAQSLVMYSSAHTAPKQFADGGRPSGYAVNLGVAILRRAGFEPETRALPWARAIKEVEAGRGVLAPVFSRTPEREQLFLFSLPVLEDAVVLVQDAARPFPFATPRDLIGKRVGTTRAARFGAELNAVLPQLRINEDGEPPQRLAMLLAGRLDAAVIAGGEQAVRYNAQRAGIALSRLRIVGNPLLLDSNYFAIARAHPEAEAIMARINAAISRMKAERSLQRQLDDYRARY